MTCKAIFRNAIVIFAACAGAVLMVSAAPVQAQMQVLGAAPPLQSSDPEIVPSTRLILHNVHLHGNTLDPSSRPVLDYAAELLRQYPDALIYVSGKGENATIQRQARAVVRYLERRGVSANRLVDTPAHSAEAVQASNSAYDKGVIVLNFATSNCGTCS